MNICILSYWQAKVHTVLESDVLSDCLAGQHLHSSASSHQENSSPLPALDDFAGMCRWNSSKCLCLLSNTSLKMCKHKEKGELPKHLGF